MKNIFITIGNLVLFFSFVTANFIGILWYGKLPKVSVYHWWRFPYDFGESYSNPTYQVIKTEYVPQRIKDKIINEYIAELYNNASFKANVTGINIPIFDGKEIIGNCGINPILHEARESYLNKN